MILTEGLNGKELLLEYKELVANKLNSSRDIKSNEEYFNWYNENKEDLKRLVTLKSSIFYIFENQIELFTVDEDTYELAVEFLSTYIKDIDYQSKRGEAGIFIWDERYLNSDVSFRATFALFDFAFDDLKLNRIISHVLSDNKRAIQFNKLMGFKLLTGQENIYNQEYNLDITDYIRVKNKYLKYFL